MAGIIANFLYSQLFVSLPYPDHSFANQTIIVTGSNVGLGLEAARHFVRLNAKKVILAVRNLDKGNAAKQSIEETTGRKNVVDVWHLDLQSYDSVKKFVKRAEGLERLDVVVENAGILTWDFKLAEDNEATITTNVVSTMLMALLILPKLRESATRFGITPHLCIVSSEVHLFTSFPERKSENIFATLNDEKTARMGDRYNVSKLLEVFAVREIAKQSTKSPLVVLNLINPGFCKSELGRTSGFSDVVLRAALARTTEHGSRSLVWAAQAGKESHGQYTSDCHVAEPSALVRSEEGKEAQRRVWDELAQKLEKIQPGILQNI
ncbi:MAG: hypothetical protein M1836_003671 [Candelina mexicana]|nr:MAG: hypothetical protein M1836_003671 [Candelina mexicana]